MPTRPLSSCSTPGCPGRSVKGGKCIEHAELLSRIYDLERGTSTERGYGVEWRRIRQAYLLANPYCVMCWKLGREQVATEVDHLLPKRRGGSDDYDNLQSLCVSHHRAKTMSETNRMRRG